MQRNNIVKALEGVWMTICVVASLLGLALVTSGLFLFVGLVIVIKITTALARAIWPVAVLILIGILCYKLLQ